MTYLDLRSAPTDPTERLLWLTGIEGAVAAELDYEFTNLYGRLRLQGALETAFALRLHSRKRILAYTRKFNASRSIRWSDGLDSTSTNFTRPE